MTEPVDFCIFSILVTGSDRGIGLGLVKRFLELPCPPKWVFATTLDLEGEETKELRDLACKYPNLVVLQLDVTQPESIQAAQKEVQKFVGEGGLTLLYNNAGIWLLNTLETENARDMMSVYSVSTIGTLLVTQAFLPLLKKAARRSPCQGLSRSKAAIINMSSIMGSVEFMGYWDQIQMIGYRCSKAALNMLTKCQSLEYSADGIMSVAIHPGSVNTPHNQFVLVTGSDQGIGLGLVKRFLELPCPPKWVFATTLDLEGEKTKVLKELACKHPNLMVLQLEISMDESTQGILTVLSKFCEEDNGTFVDWLGRQLPR